MKYSEKVQLGEKLSDKFKDSNAVIVTEYRGLTVEELTELRVELRKSDAQFRVIQNRITKKALQALEKDMSGLNDQLKGPVGVIWSYGDSAQATKTVLKFQKEHPKLVLKGGMVDDSVVSELQSIILF